MFVLTLGSGVRMHGVCNQTGYLSKCKNEDKETESENNKRNWISV